MLTTEKFTGPLIFIVIYRLIPACFGVDGHRGLLVENQISISVFNFSYSGTENL